MQRKKAIAHTKKRGGPVRAESLSIAALDLLLLLLLLLGKDIFQVERDSVVALFSLRMDFDGRKALRFVNHLARPEFESLISDCLNRNSPVFCKASTRLKQPRIENYRHFLRSFSFWSNRQPLRAFDPVSFGCASPDSGPFTHAAESSITIN